MTSHHAAGPVEPAQSAGSAAAAPGRTPHVTAVIVAHNGHRWLPKLMSSLEVSTRFPDQLVAIDTGSTDGTATYLDETLGPTVVHTVDRGLGFGAAVQVAVDLTAPVADPDGWLWLLHDDCAPAADALDRLLEIGAPDPTISVVGGRVRAWPRAQRLLEVGVTIT
ncbi:MAG: glycosyltransferase, partial [Nocardioidaceae bacterium]